jgi:hypothetical protein
MEGVLDWQRYHVTRAEDIRHEPHPLSEYDQRQLALHEEAAVQFSPDLNLGGCEREAGEGGFWRCDSPEAIAAWVAHVPEGNILEAGRRSAELVIDFDTRTITVRSTEYAAWERYLPDGWTAKVLRAARRERR